MPLPRIAEINRRRRRRKKLTKLRKRYAKARTEGDRTNVLIKVKLVSPNASKEAFIAAIPPPKPKREKARGTRSHA
jgi:hypothetical protein